MSINSLTLPFQDWELNSFPLSVQFSDFLLINTIKRKWPWTASDTKLWEMKWLPPCMPSSFLTISHSLSLSPLWITGSEGSHLPCQQDAQAALRRGRLPTAVWLDHLGSGASAPLTFVGPHEKPWARTTSSGAPKFQAHRNCGIMFIVLSC